MSSKSRTILARSSITGGRARISITVDGKTTTEALQFLTTFGATPLQIPVHRAVWGMDPRMSQGSFTDSYCTGTTFKTDIQGPSEIFLTTLPIGSSPPTSFRQILCGEILGPTFLCSRFTTSALLGFLQTRLQEGFRVEASSTPFRRVLALACTASSGHGVLPTLCSPATTFAKFCDPQKLCTIAISCTRRDAAQIHFDKVLTFEPDAKELRDSVHKEAATRHQIALIPEKLSLTRIPQFSGSCPESSHEQKERSFHTPTKKKQALEVPMEHITLALLFDRTHAQDKERAVGESSRGRPPLEAGPPPRSFTQSSFTQYNLLKATL